MEIPRHWRLKAQRYRLEGSICPTCGKLSFPPRPDCFHCTTQPAQIAGCIRSLLPTSSIMADSYFKSDSNLLKG